MRKTSSLVGVLVNARAGGVTRLRDLTGELRAMVGADGRVEVTDELSLLDGAAARLVADRPEVLALCGGDGTLSRGLAALETHAEAAGFELPPILVLPAGTMTTVIRGLGERRLPLPALSETLAHLRDRVPLRWRRHPLMRINGRPGFIFGAALISRLLDIYYDAGAGGPAGVARLIPKVVLQALRSESNDPAFRPSQARIFVDGMEVVGPPLTLVLAGTVADMGVGMRFLYRARERDDRFHVIAGEGSVTQMVRALGRSFRGRNLHFPRMFDGLARELIVELPTEETYIHDGERMRARRIEVRHGGTLRLVS